MERWFGSPSHYQDVARLREAIAPYIRYYNTERIDAKLRMSPAAYAASLMAATPLAREETGCAVKAEVDITALKEALEQVWGNNESYRIDRMKSLQARKVELNDKKSQMIHSPSANPELGNDIKDAIAKIKAEIIEIDILIAEDCNVDGEFAEFANFAIDYTEDLRKCWWELPGEKTPRV